MTKTTIGFTKFGSGPECVLVTHDWNGDHRIYAPILPYLDKNSFTYIFVDLRGYGKSKKITGEYTINEIASDCFAVADRLRWREFHIVGHSMTGMATQRMAADAPARIESAIAVCPMSAAGSQLDDETFGFFASTTENDDAFRQLIQYVTGGRLSVRWAEAMLRHNRHSTNRHSLGFLLSIVATTIRVTPPRRMYPFLRSGSVNRTNSSSQFF
jgi:pimeloyl-ACP methyl ester carboxylesterase